ncbi:AraC family transcriptional regulator [Edaphobacter aggregans]|uniref:AraC family transcriptional regulator n=1 Tax=Edaphobacter aggregans TaxID=570835 RepID=UPI0039185F8F
MLGLRSTQTLFRLPNPCTYEPSLLVIPQGRKRVDLGKESYVFGETTFLLTSIELPIVSHVCSASVERPYLAFFFKLDMGMVAMFFTPTRCRFPRRQLEHAGWCWVRQR